MRKPTITDIAKALGLTPSTVSRALAGSHLVSESTRLEVEKKASELGYERNATATALRMGVSKIVGIIVPQINRQFFSNVISGVESILNDAGYSLLICQSNETLAGEIKALKTLKSNQVAGILMSHSIESKDSSHIKEIIGNTKLVQFDRTFNNLPGAKIVNDNFHGAYNATKHLIDNGYTKIGTVAGYVNSTVFRYRLEGYKAALKDAGLEVTPERFFPNAILRDTGYLAAQKALAAGCDALYCAGDFSALGALQCIIDNGLKVPEDFGIVGTANEEFTSIVSPSISSLDQEPENMGRRTALAFLQAEEVGEVVIPMDLKIRDSSSRVKKEASLEETFEMI